jgi:hypothetical protein
MRSMALWFQDRRRVPSAVDRGGKLEGAEFLLTGQGVALPDNIKTKAAHFEDMHLPTNDAPPSFGDVRVSSC